MQRRDGLLELELTLDMRQDSVGLVRLDWGCLVGCLRLREDAVREDHAAAAAVELGSTTR